MLAENIIFSMFERGSSYNLEHILLFQFLKIALWLNFYFVKTRTRSKLIFIWLVVILLDCFEFLFIKQSLSWNFFFDKMNHHFISPVFLLNRVIQIKAHWNIHFFNVLNFNLDNLQKLEEKALNGYQLCVRLINELRQAEYLQTC